MHECAFLLVAGLHSEHVREELFTRSGLDLFGQIRPRTVLVSDRTHEGCCFVLKV